MDANTSADITVDYNIYSYLLDKVHVPCFIIFNQSGTEYIINKKFASVLRYRSVKEFYQLNKTIYPIFAEKRITDFDPLNKNATVTKHIAISDKHGQLKEYILQLKYIGNLTSESIVSGIFIGKETNDLDQTLLSFLNHDEFLDEAMFVLDFQGNILTANRKVYQIDFFTDLSDKRVNFFSLIDESEKEKLRKRLQGLKQRLILPPVEYKLVSDDRKTAYIKLYSRSIIYKKKRAILALIRDITLGKLTEKRLIQTIIETEHKERQRFASDLHDNLGPFFSGIKLYINELKSLKNEPRKQVHLLNYLLKMTDDASNRIRSIASNLTPGNIVEMGLVHSLKKMVNQINQSGGVTIHLNVKGNEEPMDNQFILALYYIALELINNGIKHSGSSQINLLLWFQNKYIQLIYTDKGKGFELNDELNANKGIGLKSILNRIILYQGSFKFVKKNAQGVRFELNFPKYPI